MSFFIKKIPVPRQKEILAVALFWWKRGVVFVNRTWKYDGDTTRGFCLAAGQGINSSSSAGAMI
jgi:hypothetical protein